MADQTIQLVVPETLYSDATAQLQKFETTLEEKLIYFIKEYAIEYRVGEAKKLVDLDVEARVNRSDL